MAGEKCGATTGCELCEAVAAVYCAADSAFLCLSCDAKVHGANFLASRHLRRRLDAEEEYKESGSTDLDSESSSSSCVSTADSCVSSHAAAAAPRGVAAVVGRRRRGGRKTRRARAELVLEGWAKGMGLASGAARRRAAKAAGALRALGRGVTAAHVPLRVAMAAALWSEIAAAGTGCGEVALLRRLEASAHVPARLVVTVASWMARAARQASVAGAKEGWAECS